MNFEIVMSALIALSAIVFIWKLRSWRKSLRRAATDRLKQERALEMLKSLRPVSGTDPDFDYKKGVPKS